MNDEYKLLQAIEKLRERMHQYNLNKKLSDNQKQELIRVSQELDMLLNKYKDVIKEKDNK